METNDSNQLLSGHALALLSEPPADANLVEISLQLQQIFANLPIGLALVDHQGQVLCTNPAWILTWNLTEYKPESFWLPNDLVKALLPRLVDTLCLNNFWQSGLRSPAEEQIVTVQLQNPTQEFHLRSVPTRNSQNQVTGHLWLIHDATDQRELDRQKSEFISVVSHELRTPLTSILGYTDLLIERDFEPAEQKQFLKTVFHEATRLSGLVEDLLGVSRYERGKVKLDRWVLPLRQVITQLTRELTLLENHRLLIRMQDSLPPVYADRNKIKQILINLITNAVKYSPQGSEIELVIYEAAQLPSEHPPGRWLIVSVRDQGIGIAPKEIPQIWERFYRVDNTTTRQVGGTGLGLHIARSLVELHGGQIWVESLVGTGSNFSFTLPVAADPPQQVELISPD